MNTSEFEEMKKSTQPVTLGNLATMFGTMLPAIKELRQHIKKLEERRTMSFEGAHDPGRKYLCGDCVQRSGALYVCLAGTTDTPGDSANWRKIGVSK